MAGLFGVESPEEVRSRIGRTGREQDLGLAQLSPGRGGVALASQLGRGAAQGGKQLLGAPAPGAAQADKNSLIRSAINEEATSQGITREKNPVEYLGLTSQVLAENGETQAAANALKFATQMDKLTNSDSTALEKDTRQIFGLDKRDKLTPAAKTFMQKIKTLQSVPRATSGVIPSDKTTTPSQIANSSTFIKSVMGPDNPLTLKTAGNETNEFSIKDFVNPDNRRAFLLAHASEVRSRLNANKQKGSTPLDENKLRSEVFKEMQGYLEVEGDNALFDLGDEQIRFNADAFGSRAILEDALSEEPTTMTGIDERL